MPVFKSFDGSDSTAINAYDSNFVKQQGSANLSDATIQSNVLEFNSWSNLIVGYTGEATDDAQLTLEAGIAQTKVGPAIRTTGTDYYYAAFEVDDGTNYTRLALYKNTTRIAFLNGTWAIASAWIIRLIGTVNSSDLDIVVQVDAAQQIAFTDTTPLATGLDGIAFNDNTAAIARINDYATGGAGVANQNPVADDDSYTIDSNAQVGDTVGTYTATDPDGTITGYAITGTAFAIDNSGVITIADDATIVAGAVLTETVTATDDDGATDDAIITVNVTLAAPSGWRSILFTEIPDEVSADSIYEYTKTDATASNYTASVGDTLLVQTESLPSVFVQNNSTIIVDPATDVSFGYQWFDNTNQVLIPASVINITDGGAPPDTVAPEITLNGANPLEVVQDSVWSDPGATVTDDRDDTRQITADQTVNTANLGIQIIDYNATDAGGNAAATVQRVINVVEKTYFDYTNGSNLVVDSQANPVTATIPKAEIWTAAPEEGGAVVDTVDNLAITDGVFTLSSSLVSESTTYLVILRSLGNTPTQYARVEAQFS